MSSEALRVCVFTGTRAEYGIFRCLLKRFAEESRVQLDILVSGAHLSPHHGHTVDMIREDAFGRITTVEALLSSDTRTGIAKSVGMGVSGYADALNRLRPDVLFVLGDRFESFAAATSAFLLGIPIAHLHGGEITLGAMDEGLRHAMTKLSSLHFTSSARHRGRVIQMGESPQRVFNVGAPGLEVIARAEWPTRDSTLERLSLPHDSQYAVVCFHPVTNAPDFGAATFACLLDALTHVRSHRLVFSTSNADPGFAGIRTLTDEFLDKRQDVALRLESRGQDDFLAVLKHADFMIGNSSSGIIEAPELKVPSIDVGTRQAGRQAATSVLRVDGDAQRLITAVQEIIETPPTTFVNPYSAPDCSEKIVAGTLAASLGSSKPFFDLPGLSELADVGFADRRSGRQPQR